MMIAAVDLMYEHTQPAAIKVEQKLSNPLFDVLDSHNLAEESHTYM